MKNEGMFVWRELMTSDVEAAKRYYGEVAGWKFKPVDMGGGFIYTLVLAGEKQVAGLMGTPPGQSTPPYWGSMVAVSDVDAATARATSKGAKILMGPETGEGIGRWTVVMDPQGAVFTLFKGESEGEDLTMPKTGEFCWEHLNATDLDAAKDFYTHVVGWTVGEGAGAPVFKFGDRMAASLGQPPPGAPSHWLTYVATESLNDVNGRVTRNGGKVLMDRVEVPTMGHFSVTQDPQGATVCFFEPLPRQG
ncbi:MAG: VOC family protein [Polyangiales bacterium]